MKDLYGIFYTKGTKAQHGPYHQELWDTWEDALEALRYCKKSTKAPVHIRKQTWQWVMTEEEQEKHKWDLL
jgi:hypothetical protein